MINFEKYKEDIIKITHDSGSHPGLTGNRLVSCDELDCESCKFHGYGGKLCSVDKWLQWAYEEYVEQKVDWSKVPIDTKVLVRDFDYSDWNRRYFAGVNEEGQVLAFKGGSTSWSADTTSVIEWNYAKLAEE